VRAAGDGTVLACEVPAGSPVRIPRLDPIRLLARRAERMTPWFYERRLAWPRWMRQIYLRALRHLSSAPRLSAAPVRPRARADDRALETEALVVGGGPAGLAAARALAEGGVAVLLVERDASLGGSGRWLPSGPVDRSLPAGVTVVTGTTCIGLYEEEEAAGIVGPDGPATVRFDRLVVATGAYDRPLAYEGNDLPGTIGLRAFERYAAAGSFAGGVRAGVVAAPGEAARATVAARAAGISLAFVAGPGQVPIGEAPAFPRRRLERVEGRGRVRSVRLQGEAPIPCEVLVVGFTQPSFELQVQAGVTVAPTGEPPVLVATGAARFPMLAVGEAAGHLDVDGGARAASAAVTAWLRDGVPTEPFAPRQALEASVSQPDAFVCLCEDVRVRDLAAAIDEGFDSAELVKRRTGAGTGPCQGKLCLGEICAVLRSAGLSPAPPTVRPPAIPTSIAALGGAIDA
jgi:sarcosine oxidase subunit alpha